MAALSPVCVTGASGFIASHIVRILLEKGYTVHGTVRDAASEAKTKHLMALPGASERLKLFSADLTGGTAQWTTAMAGCETVFHTATAVNFSTKDGENDIYKPGVQGVRDVLNAVVENGNECKTFVLTSSMAAVAPQPEPEVKAEEHWSDADKQREKGNWYGCTKTSQEKLVHDEFIGPGKVKFRFVAICPTMVFGPMIQPTVNDTMGFLLNWAKNGKGGGKAGNDSMSFVDVRDCALMHVQGMEKADAAGRYMCLYGDAVEGKENAWASLHWNDIFALLKELHPAMPDVPPCDGERVRPTCFDLRKMSTLVDVKDMRDTRSVFTDALASLKAGGHL
eukprot:TRINITY_DN29693_c0_g1_i1.p1 TRINITY_DN29693_c0_g1~~TRINITY_DN29693_c0_g1_i1.p1  ORF type:complete len:337 (+),score=69.27 TRINITY_DN29693_c0_g1_i1:107-1117(+)